jgi:hypothetical protein
MISLLNFNDLETSMKHSEDKEIIFSFKGNRNYVHGPDIFNALKDMFYSLNPTQIDIRFNGMSSKSLIIKSDAEPSLAKVNVSFVVSGREQRYFLVEGDKEISSRTIYDEQSIVDSSILDQTNTEVRQTKVTKYTFIENAVALNKLLLSSVLTGKKGKWLFTRIELKNFVDDASLVVLKLVKNSNYRIVKSDIHVRNVIVGSIYFSLLQE